MAHRDYNQDALRSIIEFIINPTAMKLGDNLFFVISNGISNA